MTPYSKDLSAPSGFFVSRGYVHALVDIRGAGASEGSLAGNYFSPREQRDGYDLIEWLAAQPWSTGKVGMMGGSYLGITQYLTAEHQPPHLRAIAPQMALSDLYRDATYHGGILSAFFGAQYLAVQGGPALLSGPQEPNDPGTAFAVKVNQVKDYRIALDYLAKTHFDQFYAERSPITHVDRIHVPTLVIDGWFDGFIRGASEMFPRIRAPKRLWIDPYPHKGAKSDFYNPAGYPLKDSVSRGVLVWFDRYLKGVPLKRAKPVKLYVMGRDRYLTARSWPLPQTSWKRMYLGSGSRLSEDQPRGGEASYATQPLAGWTNTLSRDGNMAASPYLPLDQSYESGEGLHWDTAPAKRPLTLIGPLALHLEASSSASRTDWVAKLSDVSPDGTATLLSLGLLRGSQRALDPSRSLPWRPFHPHDADAPLEPGRTYPFDIEIWPTGIELQPGHRLRLQLTSSDTPNHLAGSVQLDPADPTKLELYPNPPALNTVKLGPSYLLAPVIPQAG
jgi:putative CocE/NonD family hydrolase